MLHVVHCSSIRHKSHTMQYEHETQYVKHTNVTVSDNYVKRYTMYHEVASYGRSGVLYTLPRFRFYCSELTAIIIRQLLHSHCCYSTCCGSSVAATKHSAVYCAPYCCTVDWHANTCMRVMISYHNVLLLLLLLYCCYYPCLSAVR
jgi:hypothetical protein